MGLLSFLGFDKKEKPNLVSPVARPQAKDLYFNKTLRDYAKNRIDSEENLGFGEDFTNRMSSPAIAQIDANFRERTLPTISSEASKRGIARSSLVTDQIGRADLQRNRDIDEQVAKFQYLNELQKKTDRTQALTLGQNLDQQEAGLLSDAAAEGERVRDLTNQRAATNNQNSLNRQNSALQSLGSLISPVLGDAYSSIFPNSQSSQQKQAMTSYMNNASPAANILGRLDEGQLGIMSAQEIQKLMDSIFFGS